MLAPSRSILIKLLEFRRTLARHSDTICIGLVSCDENCINHVNTMV